MGAIHGVQHGAEERRSRVGDVKNKRDIGQRAVLDDVIFVVLSGKEEAVLFDEMLEKI